MASPDACRLVISRRLRAADVVGQSDRACDSPNTGPLNHRLHPKQQIATVV